MTVRDETITTTPTHPFYVPEKGWTEAVKLRAGDILVTSNGEYAVVEKVQHEILESPIKVYNFEVEDYHTYYVGSLFSILVHNTCGDVARGLERQHTAGMKNGKSITDTLSGKARIPDYLNAKQMIMGEAKSVRYLLKTKHLVDMFDYASKNGYKNVFEN